MNYRLRISESPELLVSEDIHSYSNPTFSFVFLKILNIMTVCGKDYSNEFPNRAPLGTE